MRQGSVAAAYREMLKVSAAACMRNDVDFKGVQVHIRSRFSERRMYGGLMEVYEGLHGDVGNALSLISSSVGNKAFAEAVETSIVHRAKHERAKQLRCEDDEDATSERQNRLMQNAVLPFARKLLRFEEDSFDRSLWTQELGKNEKVAVEIDDTTNKQTIFVCAESPSEDEFEMSEHDSLRKSVVRSTTLASALRLLSAITSGSAIHRSRATVVVGHGEGGAVAMVLALLLNSYEYDVRNVLQLGSTRCLSQCQDRMIFAVTPIRVILAGDPLPDAFAQTCDGQELLHFGESLTFEGKHFDDFSLRSYVESLSDQQLRLSYASS